MKYSIERIEHPLEASREIEALWTEIFGPGVEKRLGWMYGPETSGVRTVCWLLRSADGQLVGTVGLGIRSVQLAGKTVDMGQPMDFAIDQGHRSAGPAIMMQRTVIRFARDLNLAAVFGFPNPLSLKIFERLGYRSVGGMRRYGMPLRVSPEVVKLGRAGGVCARALAAAGNTAIHVATGLRRLAWGVRGYRVEELQEFDERFDDLWGRSQAWGEVVGERSRSYLNWRFVKKPDCRHAVFCVVDEADRLQGYIVYYDAGKAVNIADIYASNTRSLDALVGEFIRVQRARGSSRLSAVILDAGGVSTCLRRFGFYRREETGRLMVLSTAAGTNKADVTVPTSGWYATEGDRDN